MSACILTQRPGGVERFWTKVVVDCACDCWVWVASVRPDGYGQFSWGHANPKLAHRLAFETWRGPVPDGMQLDHLCRNRACVNPEHLEIVTQAENIRRGNGASARNAKKVACNNGHPLVGEHVSLERRGNRVMRRCRICKNARRKHPKKTKA